VAGIAAAAGPVSLEMGAPAGCREGLGLPLFTPDGRHLGCWLCTPTLPHTRPTPPGTGLWETGSHS